MHSMTLTVVQNDIYWQRTIMRGGGSEGFAHSGALRACHLWDDSISLWVAKCLAHARSHGVMMKMKKSLFLFGNHWMDGLRLLPQL